MYLKIWKMEAEGVKLSEVKHGRLNAALLKLAECMRSDFGDAVDEIIRDENDHANRTSLYMRNPEFSFAYEFSRRIGAGDLYFDLDSDYSDTTSEERERIFSRVFSRVQKLGLNRELHISETDVNYYTQLAPAIRCLVEGAGSLGCVLAESLLFELATIRAARFLTDLHEKEIVKFTGGMKGTVKCMRATMIESFGAEHVQRALIKWLDSFRMGGETEVFGSLWEALKDIRDKWVKEQRRLKELSKGLPFP